MKRLFLLAALVSLISCTTTKTVMKSWEGRHIDSVIASWGAPDRSMELSNGGYTHTWTSITGNSYGVSTCKQTFTTDLSGIINSWSHSGCPGLRWK